MPIPALVWAGIATAGGQVASNAIQARGNTKAAQTQSDAATQAANIQAQSDKAALDFAKAQYADQYRNYEQQQANLGPYRDLGYSSLGALAGGLGLPEPAAPQSVPNTLMPPGLAALNAAGTVPAPGAPTPYDPLGAFANSAKFPASDQITGGLSGVAQRLNPNLYPLPSSSAQKLATAFAPTTTTAASTNAVTLRAPDGTIQSVPAEQAAHYISLGAKPVTSRADVNAGFGVAL